jgi:hypothetical protein
MVPAAKVIDALEIRDSGKLLSQRFAAPGKWKIYQQLAVSVQQIKGVKMNRKRLQNNVSQ